MYLGCELRLSRITSFASGKGLVNDLIHPALDAVVKPVSVFHYPTVKLSDDLFKATGDPAAIIYYIGESRHPDASHYLSQHSQTWAETGVSIPSAA